MIKSCNGPLQEHTTDPEVFQDMDNFDLLNDPKTFASSIRLQFPKFSKGFSSSDFEPFIKSHVGEDNLISIGRLAFPNEWQMQLKSKEVRENLIRMGRTKINSRTCWISPLSQSEVRGFIHWIPNAIPNKKLEEYISSNGEVLFMENQKQSKWNSKIESDSRYFSLYLRSGQTKEDVAHFIEVGKFLGLITIRGRDPACFHCRQVGHRKTECKKFQEKLRDYSLRPATGVKRLKPRGRRHVPSSVKDGVPECVDCVKEMMASTATSTDSHQPSDTKVDETLVVPLTKLSVKKMKTKEKSTATTEQGATGNDPALTLASQNPLEILEGFKKNINEVLANTQTALELQLESAKNAQAKAEKTGTAEGKKKNKKKKKKKNAAAKN